MKYIFKLTIFALLVLLLVSCSKSSSKHNASIKLQGVLEKGKATDAICEISTLDGKVYSKSNHIDNGGYVATVPASAFDITCTIKKYINDNKTKTVKQVTPKSPLVLEAISFAKAGKNKTVNVNVITDLVAKEIKKSKNKIKDEKSFYSTEEEAKTTALKGILPKLGQSTIEDIDTLSLQDKGILTQVSLAVQAQLDQDSNMTIEQALTEVIEANSIAKQDVNNLNPDAIGIQLPKDTKPPKPIVTDTEKPANPPKPTEASISILGVTLGGHELQRFGATLVDKTSPTIELKLPVADITGVMDSKKVWLTRSTYRDHTSIELTKQDNFYQVDIKDLLSTTEVNLVLCIYPSTITKDKIDCNIKKNVSLSFGGKLASPNITDLTGATINGQAITTDGTATVGETTSIDFKLPASKVVELLNTKKVWITGKKGTAKELTNKDGFYQNANIKDLFDGSQETTFQVCILPSTIIASAVNCAGSDAIGMKSFKALKKTITDFTGAKIVGKVVPAGASSVVTDGIRWISVDFKLPIANILGWVSAANATLTGNEKVWITGKVGAGAIELIKKGDFYQIDEIKSLFEDPTQETTFQVCILPSTSIASTDCSGAIVMKSFQATMAVIPVIKPFTTGGYEKIGNKDLISSPTLQPSDSRHFQLANAQCVPTLGENQVYVSSKMEILLLENNFGISVSEKMSSLFDGHKPTVFTVCISPKGVTPTIADCEAFPNKQTFTATSL